MVALGLLQVFVPARSHYRATVMPCGGLGEYAGSCPDSTLCQFLDVVAQVAGHRLHGGEAAGDHRAPEMRMHGKPTSGERTLAGCKATVPDRRPTSGDLRQAGLNSG